MAMKMRGSHCAVLQVISALSVLLFGEAQIPINEITGFSLNPPYFNLAEGSRISATATCGEDEAGRPISELYCKLVGGPTSGLPSQTIQGQFCDYCNSAAHSASHAIDGTERWWQSPPLSRGLEYNKVNVTLDLGQLFHVAYVLIKFANSPRPDLWVLERSLDFGRTYMPWQYFAHLKRECIEIFGKQPNGRIVQDDDQICTTEYSRIVPLENGEIVVSLVNGRPGAKNFTYSPVLRDFTKATNIRLRFLRTSTLLGHLISKAQRDPTVTRRYYYSIKDISVGGRCVCHGHAQVCGAHSADNPNRLQCECQHNTCGESCDRCCPGFNQKPWRAATTDSANECQPCQCHLHATDCYYDPEVERRRASLNTYGQFDGGGVCISCQHNTAGVNCERCASGFYRPHGVALESPRVCIPCRCEPRITVGCEEGSGRCICRPNFSGPDCNNCADGYYAFPECIRYPVYLTTTKSPFGHIVDPTSCPVGYYGAPSCQPCRCSGPGVIDPICDGQTGDCTCGPGFEGRMCQQCAQGHFAYPFCQACLCSQDGSWDVESCDQISGQCLCRPGVTGRGCDRCAVAGLSFPYCGASVTQCNPAGSEFNTLDPNTGSCRCLLGVEGPVCDRCKPLYWNLAQENPHGCIECQCDVKGTLSSVGDCHQKSGECYCKPNICSPTCNTCREGYFQQQRRNYFGCQGCLCDLGGAIGTSCRDGNGQCQCRKHVEGRTCTQPETRFYFPDLYHMKYEVEDGITPNARPVRFGYNPQEFPDFSWRGYATMSAAQAEVRVTVHIDQTRSSWFHIILRFVNPSRGRVAGHVTASHVRGGNSLRQSKEVMFPPSSHPAFLTVPGEGFAEPFKLASGKWVLHIRAEGVLLDYLVLLPSSYYEARILQEKITDPCTYVTTAENDRKNCLLYKHLPMDRFPSILATQGLYSPGGQLKRQVRVRRPTAEHPEMAFLSRRQAQLQLTLRVPEPVHYVLILEYASESDMVQSVNLFVNSQTESQLQARVIINSCAYSFLCRGVAVDENGQVALFRLPHRSDILLQTVTDSFLLYKVYAIPEEDFSMDYVDPKELCVSVQGHFTEDSRFCISSQYELPPSALILEATHETHLSYPSVGRRQQAGPLPLSTTRREGVLLKSPQTEISFVVRTLEPGRYTFVVHFYQPEHPSFPVEVQVDGGRPWTGFTNASFCPHVSGCRDLVVAEQRLALDVPQQELRVTLSIPPGKTLTLDYILVIPDDKYSPKLVNAKPLDKSSDFINQCGGNNFYIDPSSASQFCRDSSRSLAAHFNDGALPCGCHQSGATGPVCSPEGGQCPCRPNVIGRQCSRCATGYYGFPHCRPCECGRRLCDEVTGQCICPPQTVRPACDACESQTYSYHPLLGCEGCDCSPSGVSTAAGPDCDRNSGQCTCKPKISGRQCDSCAPGYYGFPQCEACSCHAGGVQPGICHPDTGQCLCKKNVEGATCDRCRRGSFHFDEANPMGCTSCFCFGVTDQCRSSDKRRGKFVDMKNWQLLKMDLEEIPSVFNAASNTVVADVQELPANVPSLHWVAPPSYLGDRVSSYGGFLTYRIKSFGIPSEGMVLLDRRPDIHLSGQEMTLVHLTPVTPAPDRIYDGRVQLIEGNFRHAGTNRPAVREELMMVLSGLEALHLRGLYFTQSQRLSLGEVGLEEASATGRGVSASTVELCTCPPEYRGQSCQKCALGYYRERSGIYLGRCVPCSCNSLSNQCEEDTGRCLNCQNNTAGDRCERCAEGYYRNSAQRACQVCPCPLNVESNSFATGCREVPGGFECVCKPGYTGSRCQRCAPGYYGDPMALRGSCQPCSCPGNPSSCDSRTGVCKNALEPKDTNTEGSCQECDSCAQTLLNDLERMDEGLQRLKSQLENVSASSSAQERLKQLEESITATKNLVNKYSSSVNSQRTKTQQLEEDVMSLNDDIKLLREQADKNSGKAREAVENINRTHLRAQDLVSEAKTLFRKIQDLLRRLAEGDGGSGTGAPTEDLARMLADAERMVREMEERSCEDQMEEAQKELQEAQKLLDYIAKNVTKQCEINQKAAKRIAELLKQHESKLKDLEAALREAEDKVKTANRQNDVNGLALEDVLKQMQELKEERDKVSGQIAMAKGQLRDTANLLKMLEDSKKEYEELAAQLDGAKTDLTKKVNLISTAASKQDIVIRAEKHAENLARLAKELQDVVRNASNSSDVRSAVDAIDAYKNITEAVRAAEEAARQAKEAADEALRVVQAQDLTKRAKDLRDNGNSLLSEAMDAEKDQKEASDKLAAQRKRLKQAERKKEELRKDLLSAEDELNKIKRDDISDMIDAAKRTAASASGKANDTMDRINAILDEVKKVNVRPPYSNFEDLLTDVDKSVKNLSNTIPSLLDKISEIEELSSQIPSSNVSENIERIKELIRLARDAANRVVVPMKFTGEGHVELRAPADLEDLRAYTSLSLSLQRPAGRGDGKRRRRQAPADDMFVLYLGNKDTSKNYIGMFLKDNILFCVYKLNGVEYKMQTDFITKSPSEPAIFNKVDFRRIYENAEVILKSGNPVTNQGAFAQNLLNLDPNEVVFYVGGYPESFTPPEPLNLPKYQGCIEFYYFSDRFLGLYNFKKAVNINKELPCKRTRLPAGASYFEGTGYAKIDISDRTKNTLLMSLNVFSHSENALLLYVGNENSYYSVTVEKGYVVLRGREGDRVLEDARSEIKSFPLEKPTDIIFHINSENSLVRFGRQTIAANLTREIYQNYYIGGLPPSLRERDHITAPPLKGCVQNVKVDTNFRNYNEEVGVGQNCFSEFLVSRKAEFSLGSSLSTALPDLDLKGKMVVSLGFRSTETQGLLLTDSQSGIGMELTLEDGYVIFKLEDRVWKSNKMYNDGKWHYVTVAKEGQSLDLLVDENDVGQPQSSSSPIAAIGSDLFLGKETFKGCISNLYTRRPSALFKFEDLSGFTSRGDVLLDVCNAEHPPQLMVVNPVVTTIMDSNQA